jgi:uncharacterized protein involved in type VI secretion and phage assembly
MTDTGTQLTGMSYAALVIGTVENTEDPEGWGRVQVSYPYLGNSSRSAWAPIAAPMAGRDRGVWMIPKPGDETVLGFDRGDVDWPIVLGFLWNGQDKPPSTSTNERLIRSVNGHTIRFLDSTPQSGGNTGGLVLEDASGNSIVLTNGKVTIKSVGVLELNAATIMLTSLGVSRIVTPNANPV